MDKQKLMRDIDNLRDLIEQEVSGSTMDLIDELINMEIELNK